MIRPTSAAVCNFEVLAAHMTLWRLADGAWRAVCPHGNPEAVHSASPVVSKADAPRATGVGRDSRMEVVSGCGLGSCSLGSPRPTRLQRAPTRAACGVGRKECCGCRQTPRLPSARCEAFCPQTIGTVTSPFSLRSRPQVSNVMQKRPATPKVGPQLFQNQTSLCSASIWSATTS